MDTPGNYPYPKENPWLINFFQPEPSSLVPRNGDIPIPLKCHRPVQSGTTSCDGSRPVESTPASQPFINLQKVNGKSEDSTVVGPMEIRSKVLDSKMKFEILKNGQNY